jgi:PAS domain S-box-containing protein
MPGDAEQLEPPGEALRAAHEALSTLINSSPLAIMAVDTTGRLTMWNSAAERMFGWTSEEVLGRALPHVPGYESPLIRDALAGVPVADCEVSRRTRDGREMLVSVSTATVRGPDGAVTGAMAMLADVSQRREAETALRESEQRFREMANLLPDMLFETDDRLRLTYANRTAMEELRIGPRDLMAGLNVMSLVAEREHETLGRLVVDMTRTGAAAVAELELARRGGGVLPVEMHAAPLLGPEGAVTGFRGVLRDLSERRVAEQSERLAAVGQLAAGVAHEFNNLLAAMSGRAQLAEALETREAYDQLISTVLVASVRGADIARKLMDFAQPPEPRREAIRLEQPMDAALAVTAKEVALAGIEVRTEYESGGRRVYGDRIQLQHVFVNLILNACHVMTTGGNLVLGTRYVEGEGEGGQVVATVRDDGPGISAENLKRLFEPFFTVPGTMGRRSVKGAGLGLAVSHGIIRAHGGTITARSQEGQGTEFEIHLDVLEHILAEQETPADADVLPALVTRDRSVLVVEDEPDVLDIVARFLGKHGYHAVMAQTTSEALAVLGVARFDVVVTDLMMPGGGGREVLGVVRALDDPPPVVVITGMPVQALDDSVLALGASAYLQKPFRLADMLQTLDRALAEAEWLRSIGGDLGDARPED